MRCFNLQSWALRALKSEDRNLQLHFAGLPQIVEQPERGERHPPVPLPVTRLAHRQVVRERHEPDSRRRNAVLHGERDGGDAALFDSVADQPDGPVTKGSRGREQHRIYAILDQLVRGIGGGTFYERGRVVDGAHEGEVARSQLAHKAICGQPAEGLEGENCVEVGAFVGAVVGVGPSEIFGFGWDLTVRAIALEVVDVETRLTRQMYTAGRDEREPGPFEWFFRPDERWHAVYTLNRTSTVSPSPTT